MKWKFYTIIITSVLILTTGAFHYVEAQNNIMVTPIPKNEVTVPLKKVNVVNASQVNDQVEPNIITENKIFAQENNDKSNEMNKKQIMIDNDIYENITDDKQFTDLITIAQKYGADLYAIPYSDCFAFVKDEKPILHMSTGATAALIDNAGILLDLFASDDFAEYTDLLKNIELVIKSGKEINEEISEYIRYSIFEEDGWIYVMW